MKPCLMFNPISVQISINDYQSFAKLLVGFAEELKGGWIDIWSV